MGIIEIACILGWLTALGIGIGWLVDHKNLGAKIEARIRAEYEKTVKKINKGIDNLQGQ